MSPFETILYESGIVGKFVLSLLLGFLIGLEREYHGKPAGMRTYSLIAASSTALVILGFSLTDVFKSRFETSLITSDPTRIIHAIIVGISFLGAGAILKDTKKNTVENLTTAAGILAVSAVGVSVALSHFYLAIILTIVIIVVNKFFMYVESWLKDKMKSVKSKDPEA